MANKRISLLTYNQRWAGYDQLGGVYHIIKGILLYTLDGPGGQVLQHPEGEHGGYLQLWAGEILKIIKENLPGVSGIFSA